MNTIILKNNLEVITIPDTQSSTTIICLIIETGFAIEQEYFTGGINFIVEKLFLCGTDKYPTRRQLEMYLESLGATIHFTITIESFQIYIEVPDYNTSKIITLLSDIIQNSHIEQIDLDHAKKELREQYISKQDIIDGKEGKTFIERFFYTQNLQKANSFLTLETIMGITKNDIVDYIASQFQPSHCKLCIIGNIHSESQIHDLAEQEWGTWTAKNRRYVHTSETREEGFPIQLPTVNYRQRGSYMAELHCAFLIDNNPRSRFMDENTGELLPHHIYEKMIPSFIQDYARIVLLNQIVGVGLASRLWVKGVEEDMRFSYIESDFISLRYSQYIHIYGLTENIQFTFALESLLESLEILKRSTVSIHELSRNKEIIKAKLTLMNDNKLLRAFWIVQNFIATGLILQIDDFIDAINKIQANEIRSIALDIFVPNRLAMFISGTAKESNVVNKLIQKHLGVY